MLQEAGSPDHEEGQAPAVMGRPSKYEPQFAEQAKALCKLGARDVDLAEFFGVSVRTIERWATEKKDFCRAVKVGKEHADDKVERSLYQKATGYTFIEQQAIKVKVAEGLEDVKLVDVQKHAPPDTAAAIFWLKNRRKEQWRDKQEVDHSVNLTIDKAFETLIARINGETARVIDADDAEELPLIEAAE